MADVHKVTDDGAMHIEYDEYSVLYTSNYMGDTEPRAAVGAPEPWMAYQRFLDQFHGSDYTQTPVGMQKCRVVKDYSAPEPFAYEFPGHERLDASNE